MAPSDEVKVRKPEKCDDSCVLYNSRQTEVAHLIDLDGRDIHQWSCEQGQTWHYAEMQPDGHLIVIIKENEGQFPGMIFELDWDSRLVWQAHVPAHHDFDRLADGHTLVVCREYVENETIGPGTLKSDFIAELDTRGEVLWRWHADRHLEEIAALVPIDLPRPHRDWGHMNTVEALPDGPTAARDNRFAAGNILFSCRHIDTIGVIDRQTMRVVWAWGPGIIDKQHMPTMLPSGNILVYDNGCEHKRTRILELDPLADRIVWRYVADPPRSFFSPSRGSNQRLANGNTCIADSDSGRLFEVTPQGEIVWEFITPDLTSAGTPMPLYRTARYLRPLVDDLVKTLG